MLWKYKKFVMYMICLLSFNIFFSLQGSANQTLPLLVSQKNNTYQSVSIFQENKKIKKHQILIVLRDLPEEIRKTIIKKHLFSFWKNEFTALENVSPVKIGNAELWAIDLWRLPIKDRKRALSYHGKSIFNLEERDTLKKIIPQDRKQDLMINRLPLNDELYGDCARIPGGIAIVRFMIFPALGTVTTVVGGLMSFGLGATWSQSFAISGGIGLVITIVGSGVSYHRHRSFLAEHPITISLQDV